MNELIPVGQDCNNLLFSTKTFHAFSKLLFFQSLNQNFKRARVHRMARAPQPRLSRSVATAPCSSSPRLCWPWFWENNPWRPYPRTYPDQGTGRIWRASMSRGPVRAFQLISELLNVSWSQIGFFVFEAPTSFLRIGFFVDWNFLWDKMIPNVYAFKRELVCCHHFTASCNKKGFCQEK